MHCTQEKTARFSTRCVCVGVLFALSLAGLVGCSDAPGNESTSKQAVPEKAVHRELTAAEVQDFQRRASEVKELRDRRSLVDALELQTAIVTDVESICGSNDTNIAIQKMNLAWLHQDNGDLDMAEELLLATLNTLSSKLGSDHHYVVTNLQNLVDLYMVKEDLDTARKFDSRLIALGK